MNFKKCLVCGSRFFCPRKILDWGTAERLYGVKKP